MRGLRSFGLFGVVLVLLVTLAGVPISLPHAAALSSSVPELATEIITSPNVAATGRLVEEDLVDAELNEPSSAGAFLDVALLQLLVVFAQHHRYTITALESGGTGHCDNRSKSQCPAHDAHYYGVGVDITGIDGITSTGRDPGSIAAINTMAPQMPTAPGEWGTQSAFGQEGCPGAPTPPLPAGVITFPDACDHLHIQVPIGAGVIAASGPVVGENVAAARNKDGRIEMFAVRSDGTPIHRWQQAAGANWSAWSTFDGSVTAVAAAQNADGRLELFAVGVDGVPEHRYQLTPNGDWSPWATFGGGAVAQLSATRNKDGRLELFAVGAFGTPMHRYQLTPNGDWSNWQNFDGTIVSVTAATNLDGRVEFFGVTPNGSPEHRWQNTPGGSWSSWQLFGGPVSQVSLGQEQSGRLELFAVGANGVPMHRSQHSPGSSWSGWTNFDGVVTSVAAATNTDGRVELFAVSGSGAPEHRFQRVPGNNWSGWQTFDGSLR